MEAPEARGGAGQIERLGLGVQLADRLLQVRLTARVADLGQGFADDHADRRAPRRVRAEMQCPLEMLLRRVEVAAIRVELADALLDLRERVLLLQRLGA